VNNNCSTPTSVAVTSPRANDSYVGQRMEVKMEFSGLVDPRSSKIYFQYTGNPDISNILPSEQLVTSVYYTISVSMTRLMPRICKGQKCRSGTCCALLRESNSIPETLYNLVSGS